MVYDATEKENKQSIYAKPLYTRFTIVLIKKEVEKCHE